MPGDHFAEDAAAQGRLRASHADREQVIGVLKAAFVQGRLTTDEFGLRVGQAFTSKTYAELTAITADLPAGLTEGEAPPQLARAPRQLARTRPRLTMSAAFSAGAFAMLAALVGMLAAIASESEIGVLSAAVSIGVVGVLVFGAAMAAAWLGRTR